LLRFILLAALCACGPSKPAQDGSVDSYRANFDSSEQLGDWRCYDGGKWDVRDGWLVCDARETTGGLSILWLSRIVPREVVIEFEAECLDRPGEILAFVCGDGQRYSGYEIAVGGSGNTRVALYKSLEGGNPAARDRLDRRDFQVNKERVYAVKIRQYRNAFRVYVNDDLLLSTSDEQPIQDDRHRYFGFGTIGNLVRFDNLKIERKS